MKKRRKPSQTQWIALAILALLFLTTFGRLLYTMVDEWPTSSKVSLPEYDNLFIKSAQRSLNIVGTARNRNSEPTSSYIYDGKFNVFVRKVVLDKNILLKKTLNYRNESPFVTMDAVYSKLPSYGFDMRIKAGKTIPVSTVTFKYSGSFIKPMIKQTACFAGIISLKRFLLIIMMNRMI